MNGNRASLAYDNGVTTIYTYNLANWVTGLYNKKGSTVISSYEYTYYASGNRKSETDASGKVTSYTYDDLNRIVTESDGDNTITYTYDGRGNRTKRTVTGLDAGTTVYTYDANNRLTYESTSTPMMGVSLTAYEYDKNGNNTAKVCSGERFEYVYDAFGKLKRYITNDDIAIYAYNSSGIRTLKWVDGTTTKYILNGGDVVGEVSGGETTTYLRGINLICTDEYYYVFDAHGDVVNLTNDEGSVVKSYVYDAFGVEKDPDEADSNPFRYCGEYWDSETETYYLRARYYDPSLGRFTSEDPIKDGLNWYTYCNNNPVNLIDAWGLAPSEMEAAEMAEHIYEHDISDSDLDRTIAGWILIEVYYGREGMKMGIYIRDTDDPENPTEYVIVFKGTTWNNLGDWKNNAEQLISSKSADMWDAINYSKDFVNNHSQEITFVGHSKGGAEAASAAVATNKNAMIFNPATSNLSAYGLSSESYTASLTAYIVKGEIVNHIEGWFSTPIGEVVYLPQQLGGHWYDFWLNTSGIGIYVRIQNHLMGSVKSALMEAGY